MDAVLFPAGGELGAAAGGNEGGGGDSLGTRLVVGDLSFGAGKKAKGEDGAAAPAAAPGPSASAVFVKGLPFSATEDELHAFFGECGTVSNVYMLTFEDSGKFRGLCKVTFENAGAAAKAVAEKNGADWSGHSIGVELAIAHAPRASPSPGGAFSPGSPGGGSDRPAGGGGGAPRPPPPPPPATDAPLSALAFVLSTHGAAPYVPPATAMELEDGAAPYAPPATAMELEDGAAPYVPPATAVGGAGEFEGDAAVVGEYTPAPSAAAACAPSSGPPTAATWALESLRWHLRGERRVLAAAAAAAEAEARRRRSASSPHGGADSDASTPSARGCGNLKRARAASAPAAGAPSGAHSSLPPWLAIHPAWLAVPGVGAAAMARAAGGGGAPAAPAGAPPAPAPPDFFASLLQGALSGSGASGLHGGGGGGGGGDGCAGGSPWRGLSRSALGCAWPLPPPPPLPRVTAPLPAADDGAWAGALLARAGGGSHASAGAGAGVGGAAPCTAPAPARASAADASALDPFSTGDECTLFASAWGDMSRGGGGGLVVALAAAGAAVGAPAVLPSRGVPTVLLPLPAAPPHALLAVGSADGALHVVGFDVGGGGAPPTALTLLAGGGPVLHVAAAPPGRGEVGALAHVAAVTADGTLRQWRLCARGGGERGVRAAAHVTASLLPPLEGAGAGAVVASVSLRPPMPHAPPAPAALILGPPQHACEGGVPRERATWVWDADAGAWTR
jgi:hypothetical protein